MAQNGPECAVPIPKLWPVDLTLQNQDLLAQGQVLQEQIVAGAEQVPEGVQDEITHWENIGLTKFE